MGKSIFYSLAGLLMLFVLGPFFVLIAFVARMRRKSIVAIGPEPLINNVHHKKALESFGYSAVTVVTHTYFITNQFDRDFYRKIVGWRNADRFICSFVCQCWILWNSAALYVYFNGGPFGAVPFLRAFEPFLYQIAKVKVVVMPYGGDVQELTRSPNLLLKDAIARDYPGFRFDRGKVEDRIDRWIRHADAVISGVEWVDYMYYWDYLSVAHFSIDLERMNEVPRVDRGESDCVRVLHAPNHRTIKGTPAIQKAVEELQSEGVKVELRLVEKVSNEELLKEIAECDIVADQLVIGWYAMFAIEGMAMGKPVVCRIRDDLREFYEEVGALRVGELPLVSATPATVKDELRSLCELSASERKELGIKGRGYVEKYHSTESIGAWFDEINRDLGIPKTQ